MSDNLYKNYIIRTMCNNPNHAATDQLQQENQELKELVRELYPTLNYIWEKGLVGYGLDDEKIGAFVNDPKVQEIIGGE